MNVDDDDDDGNNSNVIADDETFGVRLLELPGKFLTGS